MLLLSSLGAAAQYSHTIQAEKLDRGVVAVKTDGGVFVSWRSLVSDDKDLSFDVYRDGVKINESPIKSKTNITDAQGTVSSKYVVKAVGTGEESKETSVWATPYMKVHLDRPAGGTSPAGGRAEQREYTYTPDDVSVGDVDGDGEWELIVKWFPTNQADNGDQYRYTGNTILDCYKLDGTKLWRIDLGRNIRSGNHYTQFMVYDFNGDGKAELICKTAPGTIDGQGKAVLLGSDKVDADYRTSSGTLAGIVVDGPEYLTVFNGETGAEINTIYYNPPRTIRTSSQWGDKNGNRCERYLAGVAYLDGVGKNPSAIFCRGYYTAAYVWAVDFDGSKLTEKWLHKSETSGKGLYGEGAHSLTIGDVDADGCDEIVYGAAILDHDGKTTWRTGAGHGDALHLGDFDPDREGLEVFMVHEETSTAYKWDSEFRDAATGEIIWGTPQTKHDIGRGLAANISDKWRGYECWPNAWYDSSGNRANKTFTCKGEIAIDGKVPSSNFRIYWDGDLLDELFDGSYSSSTGKSSPAITKRKSDLSANAATWNLYTYSNAQSCNTTKATPNLQADLFGDWREEIILYDGSTNSDLLIFTTTIPTEYKVASLMQDRQYRVAIAWQNVGYNQPPHLGYNLEESFNTQGAVTITAGNLSQLIYAGDPIQDISFKVLRATGVDIKGLPDGVGYDFDPATLTGTISGTVSEAGEYKFTITTTGAEDNNNATIEGSINVRVNTSIELIGYYPFETVGETTPNLIANQKATAAGGNGEAVEGKKGNALKLNGSNYYVQEAYDLIEFGDKSFTIEFWINSTDDAAYILNKGAIASSNGGNWVGLEYKNGALRFAVDDDVTKSEVQWAEGSTIFDGNWHHVVLARDVVAKTLFMYVDGELKNSADDKTGAINSDGQTLVIGNVNYDFNNFFTGMLDELTIYRGVMSASKVKEHYETSGADYVAYFPMDDISETTPNMSYGEATAVNGQPISVNGVKGGAISFDGSYYLTQPVYDAIQMGDKDFSIELWMRSSDDDGYLFCIGTHNTTNVEGGTGNWIGLERTGSLMRFSIDDNVKKTDCTLQDASGVFDGNWHHVVCVRKVAEKTTLLYVDGVEVASTSNVATEAINFAATELFFIGGDDEPTAGKENRTFNGDIDELIIYPKALSPEEVEEQYNMLRLSEIEDIMAESENARYTVVDAFSGRILRTAVGADRTDIVDSLQQGIYILVIEDGKELRTYKFVKR